MGVSNKLKGELTSVEVSGESLEAHEFAMLPTGNVWSSQENNTNNANYTTLPGGSTNNNNKNNWYSVVPVAEFGLIADKYLDAEDDCFSNKKNRLDACEFHYNLHRLTKLASDVEDGTYRPSPSICFILDYPTYREVFAARYKDRIVHHLVAPYITHITEAVHRANGNVSHGNRVNYSAQTACVQIQELMRKYPNGYVLKMDIQGFFMSISRDIAWNVFLSFADKYRPEGISNYENEFMLNLIHTLLMSNPTDGCEKRSPDSKWEHIKPEKSLFNNDKGLPIGNYYSQLIANLLLAIVDAVLGIPHFVDDFSSAYETLDDVIVAIDRFRELTQSIGLKAHPKKIYIQPVRHGVKFCGRVIFTDRMYISNRTVKACKNSIKRFDKYSTDTILNAKKLIQSVNSYTGIMCSLNSYNIQKSLIELAMGTKFGKYMVVKEKSNHLILNLKKEYTPKALSESAINKLDEIHRNNVRNCKELRKKRCCKDRTDV